MEPPFSLLLDMEMHTRFNKDEFRMVLGELRLLPRVVRTQHRCTTSLELAVYLLLRRWTCADRWEDIERETLSKKVHVANLGDLLIEFLFRMILVFLFKIHSCFAFNVYFYLCCTCSHVSCECTVCCVCLVVEIPQVRRIPVQIRSRSRSD